MYPGPVDGGGAPRGGGDQVQQEQDLSLGVEWHPEEMFSQFVSQDDVCMSPEVHNWVHNGFQRSKDCINDPIHHPSDLQHLIVNFLELNSNNLQSFSDKPVDQEGRAQKTDGIN